MTAGQETFVWDPTCASENLSDLTLLSVLSRIYNAVMGKKDQEDVPILALCNLLNAAFNCN